MSLTKSPFTKIHVAKSDLYEFNLIGIAPGCETPTHHHNDTVIRLEMVVRGRGISRGYQEVESKGETALLKLDHTNELTPGDVMVFDGHAIHQIYNPYPEELWVTTLYLPNDKLSTHYQMSEKTEFNKELVAKKIDLERD